MSGFLISKEKLYLFGLINRLHDKIFNTDIFQMIDRFNGVCRTNCWKLPVSGLFSAL